MFTERLKPTPYFYLHHIYLALYFPRLVVVKTAFPYDTCISLDLSLLSEPYFPVIIVLQYFLELVVVVKTVFPWQQVKELGNEQVQGEVLLK